MPRSAPSVHRDFRPRPLAALLAGVGCGAGLALASTATAQGAPPFAINNPGRLGQVTEMELSINGQSWGSGELSLLSDSWTREVRTQSSVAPTSGSLSMVPQAALCVGANCGISIPSGHSSGAFWVFEPAGVSTAGSYDIHNVGPADAGIEMVRSDADSSFDVTAGLIDLDAHVRTADYGGTASFGIGQTQGHWVRSIADGVLRDWVYVSGPGATATIVMTADLSGVSVEEPDSTPPTGQPQLDNFWTTQFYGDLRENVDTCDAIIDPTVHQKTWFTLDLQVEDDWFEEEICEDTDEDGTDDFCYSEWTSNLAVAANASRQREMLLDYQFPTDPCTDEFVVLLPFDTGALPPTLTAQATVQTNQWVRVEFRALAESYCAGALECDLTTGSSAPIPLSITSPNGTLVAWHGIAGLQAVPEPGLAGASMAGAMALAMAARRRHRRDRARVA